MGSTPLYVDHNKAIPIGAPFRLSALIDAIGNESLNSPPYLEILANVLWTYSAFENNVGIALQNATIPSKFSGPFLKISKKKIL